jgi:hypothetical protein
VVKLHPAVDRETLERWLPGLRPVDLSIGELLRDADAMLYGYSVVCYEALAAGVPAVFVRSETFLDLDQLEPYPELRRPARTPEEIRAAVQAAIDERDDDWVRRARDAVAEALAPVRGECVRPFVD